MNFFFSLIIFFLSHNSFSEVILSSKMNLGISGENDETDIEFRNIIELDIFTDFVNNEFKTNIVKIYRTGHCKPAKKQIF